jgi:hypothetical protein
MIQKLVYSRGKPKCWSWKLFVLEFFLFLSLFLCGSEIEELSSKKNPLTGTAKPQKQVKSFVLADITERAFSFENCFLFVLKLLLLPPPWCVNNEIKIALNRQLSATEVFHIENIFFLLQC